jgi:hypothetical protein
MTLPEAPMASWPLIVQALGARYGVDVSRLLKHGGLARGHFPSRDRFDPQIATLFRLLCAALVDLQATHVTPPEAREDALPARISAELARAIAQLISEGVAPAELRTRIAEIIRELRTHDLEELGDEEPEGSDDGGPDARGQ